MVVKVHISGFWIMKLCTVGGGYEVSEQQTASIFRVEVLLTWSRCPLSSGYIPHYNHCLPYACTYASTATCNTVCNPVGSMDPLTLTHPC
jgi:hypothetical protein